MRGAAPSLCALLLWAAWHATGAEARAIDLSHATTTHGHHRSLAQEADWRKPTPECGSPNEARWLGLPQWVWFAQTPNDSVAYLKLADTMPNMTMIYLSDFLKGQAKADGTIRYKVSSPITVQSTVTVQKPLVLAAGITLNISRGVELRLTSQPRMAVEEVFIGEGRLRFVGGKEDEFYIMPDWFRFKDHSDQFDSINYACQDVKCRVILASPYKLTRPWRITPNLQPWPSPECIFEGKVRGGRGQGVVLSGNFNPKRRVDLPRFFNFEDFAVKIEDASGLWLYVHNMLGNNKNVVLAPRTAIRNTVIDVPHLADTPNVFTIEPTSPDAVLEDVYAKAFSTTRGVLGLTQVTHFAGENTPALSNVTFETSLLHPAQELVPNKRAQYFILRNTGSKPVRGLTFKAPTFNGRFPIGFSVVEGPFANLRGHIKLTKGITVCGQGPAGNVCPEGTMGWRGASNAMDWGSLNRLNYADSREIVARTMMSSPNAQAAPMTSNSDILVMPKSVGAWKSGTTKTFYINHVMAGGQGPNSQTMSLGPHNQAKLPRRYQNPGIVVESVEDQGANPRTPFQLAITLKNVAGRDLGDSDWNWVYPLQFRLNIGVARLK